MAEVDDYPSAESATTRQRVQFMGGMVLAVAGAATMLAGHETAGSITSEIGVSVIAAFVLEKTISVLRSSSAAQ